MYVCEGERGGHCDFAYHRVKKRYLTFEFGLAGVRASEFGCVGSLGSRILISVVSFFFVIYFQITTGEEHPLERFVSSYTSTSLTIK